MLKGNTLIKLSIIYYMWVVRKKKFLKTLSIEIEHFSTDKTTYHDLVQNFGGT